jgi:hypothetical protein
VPTAAEPGSPAPPVAWPHGRLGPSHRLDAEAAEVKLRSQLSPLATGPGTGRSGLTPGAALGTLTDWGTCACNLYNGQPVRRFNIALVAAFGLVAAACDDDLEFPRLEVLTDSVVLHSLSRPELQGLPAAFDFIARLNVRVEAVGATENWDIAVGESGGQFVWIPAGALPGVQIRPGIGRVTDRAYEQVTEAPTDTAFYTVRQTLPITAGGVYVVRSRRLQCAFYAKVRVLELNASTGSVAFEYLQNPNCGDRTLVPIGGT